MKLSTVPVIVSKRSGVTFFAYLPGTTVSVVMCALLS
jgi:hypothetical protein